MKKLKITLLVFYVLMIIILIYESAIPESLSVKEHNFFKKIVNNVSRAFVKTKYINAEEIVVNTDIKESYYINDTLTLNVSVKPDNASYKELEFASTDSNVLTIDDAGLINFISTGNASVIISQKESNLEKKIDFKVIQKTEPIIEVVEPKTIDFKVEKETIDMGDISKVSVLLYAEDTTKTVTDNKITFTSSDDTIAKVFDYKIYALSSGTATITVTHDKTGLSKSIDINVLEHEIVKPKTFKIKGDSVIYMNDKTTHTYSIEIDPDASNIYKNVYYSASYYNNEEKRQINEFTSPIAINWRNGTATLISAGYSAVYVYAVDVLNGCWSEYVSGMVVRTINTLPSYTLKDRRIVLGEPYKLEIKPGNASKVTYDKYNYFSSDETVASVDNLGNITPHKKGKTVITVSVSDGYDKYEDSFELTVDSRVMEDNMGKKSFSKFVRKGLSHFMGFVVFGLISSFMFLLFINSNYDGNKKLNIVVTIVNGLVFACLTEFVQLFAIDRTAQFKDIAIDYLGYMLAVTLSFIIITTIYLIKKKKQKTIENDDIIE